MQNVRLSPQVIGMSSVQGVAKAVGGWRAHMLLSESDGDASPEAPDRFKKLRSGSSLNSLRMSLRKRLPLKPVRSNTEDKRSWEPAQDSRKLSAVRLLTRSACNSFGSVCQVRAKSRQHSSLINLFLFYKRKGSNSNSVFTYTFIHIQAA